MSLVQSGPVQSAIWDRSRARSDEIWNAMPPIAHEQYGTMRAGIEKQFEESVKRAVPAQKVAQAVRKALEARRPKPRYKVNAGAAIARFLPDRWRDSLARRILAKSADRSG